jgi:hypothetical protein
VCHFAECQFLFVVMQSAIMLSVIMLKVFMACVVAPSKSLTNVYKGALTKKNLAAVIVAEL